jgi:hypothetical protein
MTGIPLDIDDFIPHRTPVSLAEIRDALDDLGAVVTDRTASVRIDLPHTAREDGTIDCIEIGTFGGLADAYDRAKAREGEGS